MGPELPHFKPRDLATSLWGLQHLRYLPPMEWMLQAHALLRVRVPQLCTQSLVVTLSALGGYAPVYQVRVFVYVCVCLCLCKELGIRRAHTHTHSHISTSVHTLSHLYVFTHTHTHTLHTQVEEGLLDALHAHLLPRIPTLSPASTVTVCVALARLGGSSAGRLPAPVCDALFLHAHAQVRAICLCSFSSV